MQKSSKKKDVILVIGTSAEERDLNIIKQSAATFSNKLLEDQENRLSLITFSAKSKIVTNFTNDQEKVLTSIHSIESEQLSSYYRALESVETILRGYQKQENRETMVVFLTCGKPSIDHPNQILKYRDIKKIYPDLIIHGIQYGIGKDITQEIKEISNTQTLVNEESLESTMLEIATNPLSYNELNLTTFIENENFKIKSIDKISASYGKINLEDQDKTPKVCWDLTGLRSGKNGILTIDLDLIDTYQNEVGIYAVDKKTSLIYKIGNIEEETVNNQVLALASHYKTSYDNNLPPGCSINNTIEPKEYQVYETVEINQMGLSCEEYQFLGWKIATENTVQINEDYFLMPEKNVILRAEWGRFAIVKSMEGEIHSTHLPILQSITSNYNQKLWKYKEQVTKIVIQDVIKEISNAQESWDISSNNDGSVIGRLVINDSVASTYTVYIQGDGDIIANTDSNYLFSNFKRLVSIEGMEHLNTSNTTNIEFMFRDCESLIDLDVSKWQTISATEMDYMFSGCKKLQALDLNNFNTSNVTTIVRMFNECSTIKSLDLSSFDTAKVTDMSYLFRNCTWLENLTLGSLDTSSTTNMSYMFTSCTSLSSLDVSTFNTQNVTNMEFMFDTCSQIEILNLDNFDTSKVTNLSFMFRNCSGIKELNLESFYTPMLESLEYIFSGCNTLMSINISNFNTTKVRDFEGLFYKCQSLSNIDLANFDTRNVQYFTSMFYECRGLRRIDVSNFETQNAVDMRAMFAYCSSLENLDLSNFNTMKVIDMSSMFRSCAILESLDLSNFRFDSVTTTTSMFEETRNIITTFTINNPNITEYLQMFKNAAWLDYNGQIKVNYIQEASSLIDQMIETKSTNSNIIKGEIIENIG